MIETWPLAALTVLLAGLLDALFGEPPNALHPVAWLGSLIAALERRCPRGGPRREFAGGVLVVVITISVAAAAGVGVALALAHLPWWLSLPLGAMALKVAFSLRGLVRAGRSVQRALESDTEAARAGLRALVSRSRELEPPQIASAAIESLAENLSDSVVAPLLYFALFGLPGALVYRAINTLDAMIGYHGRYEYLGKPAARLDDAVNWVPARLSGLLLVALAALATEAPPPGRRCADSTAARRAPTSSARSRPWPAPSVCSSKNPVPTWSASATGRPPAPSSARPS